MGRPHDGHARPSTSNTRQSKSLHGIQCEERRICTEGGSRGWRGFVGGGAGTTRARSFAAGAKTPCVKGRVY